MDSVKFQHNKSQNNNGCEQYASHHELANRAEFASKHLEYVGMAGNLQLK